MPDDQWPPPAPHVNKAFKKAHAATNENVPPPLPVATKKEIQDLERLRKKATPQLNLNPPGMKRLPLVDEEREKRIAKMKERLQPQKGKTRDDKGKARDDFDRSR
jgi:hypothetical protein